MSQASAVEPSVMQGVYDALKTPFKYGTILTPPAGTVYDCPSVFRYRGRWYMMFVSTANYVGYETHMAVSDDLLKWKELGKILPFRDEGWDRWQADGGIALQDYVFGGTAELETFEDHYWLSYLGGSLQGYETDPLAIGLAHTQHPDQGQPWHRLETNPVMSPADPDVRPFEKKTLYKSYILRDRAKTLGHEFVMYYNGKQEGPGTERIGMAVSDNMRKWKRYGDGPVIDNGPKGISGDAQVVQMTIEGKPVWVMIYFGHVWKPRAFDTFACSYDMVNWIKWEGPHLVEPTEEFDSTFAHKPWMIKWEGVVYHFYCAVNKKERTVAVATSKAMK